jgi:hypothetical protein
MRKAGGLVHLHHSTQWQKHPLRALARVRKRIIPTSLATTVARRDTSSQTAERKRRMMQTRRRKRRVAQAAVAVRPPILMYWYLHLPPLRRSMTMLVLPCMLLSACIG